MGHTEVTKAPSNAVNNICKGCTEEITSEIIFYISAYNYVCKKG